ncbi:MAG: hypothetical protein C3F11_18640 [Methylocystaceae bacterium]|nr:MAG: hypothetical protein C3F11_18640 [Methylocystaceae bacterium]
MRIDHAFLHEITIDILYGCLALLVFVLLERLVYYGLLALRARRINAAIRAHALAEAAAPTAFGADELSRSFSEYVAAQNAPGVTRGRVEDLSSALFIRVDAKVSARLWILDTIVTAAPLLGLLGTILGIMDTFNALSSGGVSDPAAVSRGIAAALIATAIGIGTALVGLVAHNLLHRQADVIIDGFKSALLAATRDGLPTAAE